MPSVVGQKYQVVVQGGGGDGEIKLTDRLTNGEQLSILSAKSVRDLIRKRKP